MNNLRGGEEVVRRRRSSRRRRRCSSFFCWGGAAPPAAALLLELLSAVHSVAINPEVANDLSSTTRERVKNLGMYLLPRRLQSALQPVIKGLRRTVP